MTTFTGTTAIALTWNAAGHCQGVRLRRVRDRCRVVQWWQAEKAPGRSVAETLAEGLRSLDPGGNPTVVACCDDAASGCIDLDMPDLRPDELRNALTFELRRSAPVADETLTWAYRLLPGRSGPQIRVRVYYVRQATWERLLDDVSLLSHSLDLIIPPAAALDPVLAGTPVCLGGAGLRFLFAPGEKGRRDVLIPPESGEPPNAFGAGPTPLAAPHFEPGELASLPTVEQARFAAAAVLAMYGLSRSFAADRRTGFELPYDLRPRRHRHTRLIAAALAVYVAVLCLYGAGRFYADRRRQFAEVHAERLKAEAAIGESSKRLNQDEAKFMTELRKEVEELSQPRPSLAPALAEVSRRVGRAGWCTAFRWSDGLISLQLRETQEIEDLERTLELSPLLGDVRQESKKVQAGITDRKVEMNARYDLPNEPSAAAPPAFATEADKDEAADEGAAEETAPPRRPRRGPPQMPDDEPDEAPAETVPAAAPEAGAAGVPPPPPAP
jgi:hypothetical protein